MTQRRSPDLARRLAVYLVADPEQTRSDLLDVVELALAGGVTAVQLRAKQLSDRQAFELGGAIAARCRSFGALMLVNDRLDLALAIGADGVHLGVADLPLLTARGLVDIGFILGFSPETDDQAAAAEGDGATYLGIGPVFGTASKSDAGAAIGLETLRRRVELAGLPSIGIGGVHAGNAGLVIAAGAVGVAVISAVLHADSPAAASRDLFASVQAALDRQGTRS